MKRGRFEESDEEKQGKVDHYFCIFRNGQEHVVHLTWHEYYSNEGLIFAKKWRSERAQSLCVMEDRYLRAKKKQQARNNAEALCFRFCAKYLPLTRDVVNLICSMITSRPFEP